MCANVEPGEVNLVNIMLGFENDIADEDDVDIESDFFVGIDLVGQRNQDSEDVNESDADGSDEEDSTVSTKRKSINQLII